MNQVYWLLVVWKGGIWNKKRVSNSSIPALHSNITVYLLLYQIYNIAKIYITYKLSRATKDIVITGFRILLTHRKKIIDCYI